MPLPGVVKRREKLKKLKEEKERKLVAADKQMRRFGVKGTRPSPKEDVGFFKRVSLRQTAMDVGKTSGKILRMKDNIKAGVDSTKPIKKRRPVKNMEELKARIEKLQGGSSPPRPSSKPLRDIINKELKRK